MDSVVHFRTPHGADTAPGSAYSITVHWSSLVRVTHPEKEATRGPRMRHAYGTMLREVPDKLRLSVSEYLGTIILSSVLSSSPANLDSGPIPAIGRRTDASRCEGGGGSSSAGGRSTRIARGSSGS